MYQEIIIIRNCPEDKCSISFLVESAYNSKKCCIFANEKRFVE